MDKLIDINGYPVCKVLDRLLEDKTTKKNIIFATNTYNSLDKSISETTQMTYELIRNFGDVIIQPRVQKSMELQALRTRNKAEVFTPSWICNKMNNHLDEEWFGREGVFNTELENAWETNKNPVEFKKENGWKKYVDSRRLEITCGEAPYIVSRYDTSTGKLIPIADRIGMLDRKLRVVSENCPNEKEWIKWSLRAFQSIYGYEFQGDNLLIARINLLETFVEYMRDRWNRNPSEVELKKIANVIAWNIWQMDGISGLVPFGKQEEQFKQLSIFDFVVAPEEKVENEERVAVECRIFDWRSNESLTYNSMKER